MSDNYYDAAVERDLMLFEEQEETAIYDDDIEEVFLIITYEYFLIFR
jgi:hypothetical protein